MSRQSDLDNHADQINPNNDAYWESRGWDDRPDDWDDRVQEDDTPPDEEESSQTGPPRELALEWEPLP